MDDVKVEYLGKKIKLSGANIAEVIEFYEGLITDVIRLRAAKAGKNPDDQSKYIEHVLDWVRKTDFYKAPASTRYHESFESGLLFHTMRAYNEVLDLIELPKFKQHCELQSAVLCILTHDWCKIGRYEVYLKNQKNEKTNQWEKVPGYKTAEVISHPFGHGVTSMYMAGKTFNLTEEEALAIRYHMGLWDCSEYDRNDMSYAKNNYPLINLIQFADQMAITNY